MRLLRKIVRFLDKVEDTAIFLVYILLFLIGSYALYDSYLVYENANDTSLLKYKPGYVSEEATVEKPIQGRMAAWVSVEDTTIDYPIMQGDTNTEYLNKDPYGDYSLAGSIFLDFRNAADFSDPYSLVYGHHMAGGLMFGALDEFLDRAYFETHRNAALTVGETEYTLWLFSVLETEATNEMIFSPTETPAADTWRYVEENSLYLEPLTEEEKKAPLVALSTCKYPATAERTVVLGVLLPT